MKRAFVLLALVAGAPLGAAQMYTAGPTCGAMPVVDLNPKPEPPAPCGPACEAKPQPTLLGITSGKTEVIPGKTTNAGVGKLTALKWHTSLAEATKAAGKHGKPILWLQILGQLQGFA
jgi:hypothetical protein